MAKMRVYELSKELGIQSKDLIIILNQMGAGVKNHMSTVDEEYITQVRSSFSTAGATPRKQKASAPESKEGAAKKKEVDAKTAPKAASPSPQKTTVQKKEQAKGAERETRTGAAAPRISEKRKTAPVQPSKPGRPDGKPALAQPDRQERKAVAGKQPSAVRPDRPTAQPRSGATPPG